MENSNLEIKNLSVKVDNKLIFENLNLKCNLNQINILLGPNGIGKSTLANIIMGDTRYDIIQGEILFNGENITNIDTSLRAKKGIFLSFQHPQEIEGINILNFLKSAYNNLHQKELSTNEFLEILDKKMLELGFDKKFRSRYLNVGFSGGEKKKLEILQLLLFEPKFAILDEIDSGLDIDALRLVGQALSNINKKNKMGMLIITHYNKILDYINPDNFIVLQEKGKTQTGGIELLQKIEKKGFN
jgi:Fe-S cluster assembly ATP-binding protein